MTDLTYDSKFKDLHFMEVPKANNGGRKPRTVRIVKDHPYEVASVVVDGRGKHKPLSIFRKHLIDPTRWVLHPPVVVNGNEHLVLAPRLTYDRACQLAGLRPQDTPTVVWTLFGVDGRKRGTLVECESIELAAGLELTVTITGNA